MCRLVEINYWETGDWFVFFIFSSLKRLKWNRIECRVSEVLVEIKFAAIVKENL
jgi:hypothetical protein